MKRRIVTRAGRQRSARVIMLVRHPRLGAVKTRIGAALGEDAALDLHVRLARHALRRLTALSACREAIVEVRTDAAFVHATRELLGRGPKYRYQGEGDLGDRLALAFADSFGRGDRRVVVVGSDCPRLETRHLREALTKLVDSDVVIGPAEDGGYYLIGARSEAADRVLARLFADIAWGSSDVYAETMNRARNAGLSIAVLEALPDVDRSADVEDAESVLAADAVAEATVSVVIPALNESARIATAVESALAGGASEVIVVDAGSSDATAETALHAGAVVITAQPGRARQMNAGATVAAGTVLCFLHADTQLPVGFAAAARAALSRPRAVGCAFDFAVDAGGWRHALVGAIGQLRWRLGGLPYGDQGVCVPRWVFDSLGGFAALPTMEDYEFAQRLRRYGRITSTGLPAVTSARTWDRHGLLRPTFINAAVIAGYRLGASPMTLARWRAGIGVSEPASAPRTEGA